MYDNLRHNANHIGTYKCLHCILSYHCLEEIYIDIVLASWNEILTLRAIEMKLVDLTNSVEPDEAAHYEPPNLVVRCLSSGL